MSAWLELRGVPVLHGGIVETSDGAVAILARSGTGKSTLLFWLHRLGQSIMADDQVAVFLGHDGPRVLPAFPMLKVTRTTLSHLGVDPEQYVGLGDGARARRVVGLSGVGHFPPLRSICILDRRPAESSSSPILIRRLTAGPALRALLAHPAAPNTIRSLGLAARRFPILGALATSVAVFKVSYPAGYDQLQCTADAILATASA